MKVVIAAYGSRGDTEPCIAAAEVLQRRGHDVRMAVTIPPEMCDYVESVGLVTTPYGRDWQQLVSDDSFNRMLQNPMGAIPQAVEYVAQAVAEKNATLVSLADEADLIVAGMTEQEAAANVAEHYRIPLVALHFFPTHILQHGFARAGRTPSVRAQRRALGLPDESPTSADPLEIQAYDEICISGVANSRVDSTRRRPFVGALTLQLPTDGDAEVLEWISTGDPPVYFGFGSMPVPVPRDIIAVISTACARVDTRGLICLGPNYIADAPNSDHVKVVREVNHAVVFPACRAVVHHGGAGTTAASLRAGVPALVLWSGLDQPVWATSVSQLEVGFGRSFSESTLDSLVADLRVIFTPRYATRAKAVAQQMTAPAESLARTADLLEVAASSGRQD